MIVLVPVTIPCFTEDDFSYEERSVFDSLQEKLLISLSMGFRSVEVIDEELGSIIKDPVDFIQKINGLSPDVEGEGRYGMLKRFLRERKLRRFIDQETDFRGICSVHTFQRFMDFRP